MSKFSNRMTVAEQSKAKGKGKDKHGASYKKGKQGQPGTRGPVR
ncbi:hypothetical protein N9S00_07050 [Luminiphilus sp.]|nr:hypothetical protein [Luminiphilus sp.]